MRCSVHDLEDLSSNLNWVHWVCIVCLSKSSVIKNVNELGFLLRLFKNQ